MDSSVSPTGVVILDANPAFVAAAADFIGRLGGYVSMRPGVVR